MPQVRQRHLRLCARVAEDLPAAPAVVPPDPNGENCRTLTARLRFAVLLPLAPFPDLVVVAYVQVDVVHLRRRRVRPGLGVGPRLSRVSVPCAPCAPRTTG